MTTVFGITNCDTVRKARRWLDDHAIRYRFHDFRKDGLNADLLQDWLSRIEWERLVNRKGRTFRTLGKDRTASLNRDAAMVLMLEHPTIIKRPVVEVNGRLLVGFDEALYRDAFGR